VDGGLVALLPSFPAVGAVVIVVAVAIRMLVKADTRYHGEVRDHERTQQLLDDERARRRKAEDDLAQLAAEVHGLRAEVLALRRQVADLTRRLGE
jgi:hypothetical protein